MSTSLSEISLLVLTADRKVCVQRLIAALLRLQPRNFELVVVVGRSEDDTQAYLESLHLPFSLRIFATNSRMLTHNRNVALRAASCPLVLYIDDDALPLHRNWHQRYLDYFKACSPKVACVGGHSIFKDGIYEGSFYRPSVNHLGFTYFQPDPGKLHVYHGLGNNLALRREAALEAGGFDEFLLYSHEEVDLAIRLGYLGYSCDWLDDNPVYHFKAPNLQRIDGRPQWASSLCSGVYYSCKHYKHLLPGLLLDLYSANAEPLNEYYRLSSGYSFEKSWKLWSELFRHAFNGLRSNRRSSSIFTTPLPPPFHRPCSSDVKSSIKPMTIVVGIRDFTMKNLSQETMSESAQKIWDLSHQLYINGHNIVILSSALPKDFSIAIGWQIISTKKHFTLVSPADREIESMHPFAFEASFAAATMKLGPRSIFLSSDEGTFAPLIGNGVFPVIAFPIADRACGPEDGKSPGRKALAKRLFDLYQGRHADGLVLGDEKPKNGLKERCGPDCEPHPNVRFLPFGVSLTGYEFSRETHKKLVWASRSGRPSNLPDFLDFLPGFLEAFPEWRVDIVGPEQLGTDPLVYLHSLETKFRKQHGGKDWNSRLRFHRGINEMSFHHFCSTADLYVIPGQTSPFDLSFQEAMQYGVPIVGYVSGPNRETAEIACGVLVPENDKHALEDAIRRLAACPETRKAMGEEGRRQVGNYNLSHYARSIEAFFDITLRNFNPDRKVPGLAEFIAEQEKSDHAVSAET